MRPVNKDAMSPTGKAKEAIAALWEVHREAGWPPCGSPDEGELMTLDTVISGCVTYYLDSDEGLDEQRIGILEDCVADLDGILPDLSDEAEIYFERARGLAALLLDSFHRPEGKGLSGR